MKKKIIGTIIFVLFVAIALIPDHVTCGVPSYTCAVPPDEDGRVSWYYEVQPLFVTGIESLTQSRFPFYYYSGTEYSVPLNR
jgi:hypothetical protein